MSEGKHASTASHHSNKHNKRVLVICGLLLAAALVCVIAFPAPRTALLSAFGISSNNSQTETSQDSNAQDNAEVLDRTSNNTSNEAASDNQTSTNKDAGDTTPLDTSASASVVTVTTPEQITVNAPDGFVETPSYAQVASALSDIQAQNYNLSFVMLDLSSGRSMSYNADERLYPASSIKAAYCTMVMENNGGSAGMASTIEDCLVNSSNDAFHTLIDTFGLSSYGAWLEAHGAPQAGSDAYVYYYPWISANEFSAIWQEIWRYGTSEEAGGAELGSYLAQTNHSAMGDLLRNSYEVWSKPGWYPADGNGLEATVDAGVVFSDCGPYVLIVMSNASEDFDALLPLIDALNAAHGKMCGGSSVLFIR